MKKIEWYYDRQQDNPKKADEQYRRVHRKSPRILECQHIVNGWKDCTSVLDYGCKSLGFVEMLGPQYTKRVQVDHYFPETIKDCVREGFFRRTIDEFVREYWVPFDVVCAFEVFEHVEPKFRSYLAEKLLTISSHYVLISIPYNWAGPFLEDSEVHPHRGYNESNILEWFYPYYPDWTKKIVSHLIACFDVTKEEIIKQELK